MFTDCTGEPAQAQQPSDAGQPPSRVF